MTRLSTTNRFTDLVDFMDGLKEWLIDIYVAERVAMLNIEYKSKPGARTVADKVAHDRDMAEAIVSAKEVVLCKYHDFNRFAVILAAVAQKTDLLARFTEMYTDSSSDIDASDMNNAKWELVSIMKMLQLPKGVAFLASHWRNYQSKEMNRATGPGFGQDKLAEHLIMEGEEEANEGPAEFDDLNDLPNISHIHLTDENQMRLLAFVPEFDSDEPYQVSEMRPNAHQYMNIDYTSRIMKPEYFITLNYILNKSELAFIEEPVDASQ
ncbi:hypothetical protein H4R33_005584 [Dimargaris cristalligena]|nr:hypothetical protein H4R33_005584 [Dimargaris cristalligena]